MSMQERGSYFHSGYKCGNAKEMRTQVKLALEGMARQNNKIKWKKMEINQLIVLAKELAGSEIS